jgi:hypothetical protein
MSSGGGGTGATASYYQQATAPPQHGDQQSHPQHSPTKYPENGHDTLSDFVHFVCQEAETQETQVCGVIWGLDCWLRVRTLSWSDDRIVLQQL